MTLHIIGDIHGHAEKLSALLQKLGYEFRQGAYRHPSAIFVGDFIDRGPHQLKTLDMVRRMVDAGSARAIMGNHEFNAIAWHTLDPDTPDEFLRLHGGDKGRKNQDQHKAFLTELQDQPARHTEIINWFKTLPLWLDLPGLRIVHACWHEGHMQALSPLLTSELQLTDETIIQACRDGSPAFHAVETLLKGIEVPLPLGQSFQDKDWSCTPQRACTLVAAWYTQLSRSGPDAQRSSQSSPTRYTRPRQRHPSFCTNKTSVLWPLLAERHTRPSSPHGSLRRLQRRQGRPACCLLLGRRGYLGHDSLHNQRRYVTVNGLGREQKA
jgi:metallophosphoesterase